MMFFKLPQSKEYINLAQVIRIVDEPEQWALILADGNIRIVSKTSVVDIFKLLQKTNKHAAFLGLTVLEI